MNWDVEPAFFFADNSIELQSRWKCFEKIKSQTDTSLKFHYKNFGNLIFFSVNRLSWIRDDECAFHHVDAGRLVSQVSIDTQKMIFPLVVTAGLARLNPNQLNRLYIHTRSYLVCVHTLEHYCMRL
jgi:hypothetical protein